MTSSSTTRLAWALGGVIVAVMVAAGVLIASRVPSNPIGWILLVAGVGTAVQELGQQYALYGLYHAPGSLPAADVAAWTNEWVWIPYMAAVGLVVPMIYPTGRLLSPRWRPVLAVGLTAAAIGTVCFALAPGEMESSPGIRNPLGIEGAGWIRQVGDIVMLTFAAALLAGIVSVALRYRIAGADERQQLKWLLLGLSLLASMFLIGVPYWSLGGGGTSLDVVENLLVLALASIPVAICIAILRYRLYDVDLVIKKTVVYAVLAVLLFVLGVVPAWVTAGVVFWLTGESEISWALAGLVVGIALWPLRRVATRIADRIVYGRRATPYEVLSDFSARVAETYAADDVLERMAQVLGEAVGADAATVWLGAGDRARPVASWPSGAESEPALPASAVEVRHQGAELGALSVRMSARDPMTPARERLIRDLAGQAGLVLRNAALIDDLRASRQRLVAAQNEERRRTERNIHDGAQQQLVALAVKLKLADSFVGTDEDRVHAMLADLQTETNDALEDLRDLARGIYPPLLADKGLGAALESQARKSAVPVSVETDGIGRFPQEAEAAVYFSALEALQNVAKYAEASSVLIRLAQVDGTLTFEIADDGVGFDPAAVSHGTGLQGIADRLAALGGTLEVRSAPGDGTTVTGRLPVEVAS